MNSAGDPQISRFSNFFIKNWSHGTIYTFKDYFATIFLVFNFQFQQNKFYPNGPITIFQFKDFSFSTLAAIKNGEKRENDQGNFFFYLFFKNVSFRWRLVK